MSHDDVPADLRCSFCNKSQHFVRKLVAGPNAHICDECIAICVDVIGEDRKEPIEARQQVAMTPYHVVTRCSLCEVPAPLEHMVAVRSRGALCPGCIGAIEAAIAAAREERE